MKNMKYEKNKKYFPYKTTLFNQDNFVANILFFHSLGLDFHITANGYAKKRFLLQQDMIF